MPAAVSYPGVYIVEEASGARAIAGVPTSIAAFIGMAEQGRLLEPVKIQNMAQFEAEYGALTSGELADQVRQFYLNGGGAAYVSRIAHNPIRAAVTLRSESGVEALRVVARDPGLLGDMIRVEIDYGTASPERTFNLTAYRRVVKPDGVRDREKTESYGGLSMDPASPRFIESAINGISSLITVSVLAGAPAPAAGVSIAGRVLPTAAGNVRTLLNGIVTASARSIRISVANNPPVTVALTEANTIVPANSTANLATQWASDINTALAAHAIAAPVVVEITGGTFATGGIDGGRLLQITCATGPVEVLPAAGGDVATALGLGVAAGGIEGDSFGDLRPAPTGLVARNGDSTDRYAAFRRFLGGARDALTGFTLNDDSPDSPHGAGAAIGLGGPNEAMVDVGGVRTIANARAALDVIAASIDANSHGRWSVKRKGNRLTLLPRYGGDNTGLAGVLTTQGGLDLGAATFPFVNPADPARDFANVAAFTVGRPSGVAGAGGFQGASVGGDNGTIPDAADYAAAFAVFEREVDLFNLMVLPRAAGQGDAARQALWGTASAFCERERAFLIVDPPASWTNIALAEAGVDPLRIGIATRNAAAYWPRLRVADGTATGKVVDPAGSIAGVIARTDGNRGVWKAPAGLEATIRGVAGVDRKMSDPDNGAINPKALNAVRAFPAGAVAWGARTLVGFDGSGNIDDKYIPVRRTMMFIEESLYRGLHFAVFEPNDEPLWAQIRLAAGSFMNGLFRQGAFQGRKTSDAYFVACDTTTTTPTDINLGIVNVIVGFAPLKPAEFVVLTVKQIAGQVQI
jgi:hypothetical protein